MTHTRSALSTLSEAIRGIPRNAHLPPVAASALALKVLGAVDKSPAAPQEAVLEQVRGRLQLAAKTLSGVQSADQRDIRSAVWLLWPKDRPMFAVPGLKTAVLRAAEIRDSMRRNLIEAWIQHFRSGDAEFVRSGAEIRDLLARHADARLQLWKDAGEGFSFFDGNVGPSKVAEKLLRGEEAVENILQSIGFDDPLRSISGYAKAIHARVLADIPLMMRTAANAQKLDRAISYLAPNGKLRFGEEKAAIAVALLEPWKVGGREPSEEVRERVQSFLLTTLNDPRVSPEWNSVPPEYTAVMLRWLAKVALNAFFQLVERYADDRHFRYRKAFWSAYVENKHVSEAWLALGSSIYHYARTMSDLKGAFGRLEGSGVAGNQAVFLLRVGDLIFCEWSHNGKLRAWRADWKAAPKLRRARYSREDLRGNGLPFPADPVTRRGGTHDGDGLSHFSSEVGYWQASAAELIARSSTHARLTRRDWMPR